MVELTWVAPTAQALQLNSWIDPQFWLPMFMMIFVVPLSGKYFQVLFVKYSNSLFLNSTPYYTIGPWFSSGFCSVCPDAKLLLRSLTRKSCISRYPLSCAKALTAVIDPTDHTPNEGGGESTTPTGPRPDLGGLEGETEPKQASTPGWPPEFRFGIPVAPGFGGIPFTFPIPKEPTGIPKGLVWVDPGTWGEPMTSFPEARSENVSEGALSCWRRGADLRILTRSPTAACGWDPIEPGCPSDSNVSAVFCLITRLSILSQSLQVSNYVEHKHVHIHSFSLKMPDMSSCLEGLVLLRGPSRDHYTYTFCCPQQQEFYMQLYLYVDLHDSSRPHFRCINIYPDPQSSLYLWPWLTKDAAHNAWQANINLRNKKIFHIMQTKPPSHPCSNFASMGVLTATITYMLLYSSASS